jgi:hypothetical protein
VDIARRRNIEKSVWRRMGDENIDSTWNLPPPLNQLLLRGIVGESGKIRTPWRTVNRETSDLHQTVFKKRGMSKAELPALKEEVMIPSNANHMLRWSLSKPGIDIIKSLLVLLLDATKVSAMNQNVALRNRQFSVLPVGVGDYAD